jgi:hypothetical protein
MVLFISPRERKRVQSLARQDASGCLSTYEESDRSNIVRRVVSPSTTTAKRICSEQWLVEQNEKDEGKEKD